MGERVLEGICVVVVEDDADNRELIALALRLDGARVESAATAGDGLLLVEALRPSVIVCDITLPDADGYEFIRRVRALPEEAGGGAAAVAMTGHASSEDRDRALAAGFQWHLAKPVPPADLVARVAALAGGSST